jgi:hypothetical protein
VENSAENTQHTATDDLLLDDSPEDDGPVLEEPTPARQGLPPGFRMRHDRHYVDELVGRRVTSAPRPIAHTTESAPAPSRDRPDETTRPLRAALTAVAERLDAVREHAGAMRPSGPLTSFDRALQVEIDRASRLARAAVALAGEVPIARRELSAGEFAERLKNTIGPLRKYSGLRFEVSVEDPGFRIAMDSGAVTHALAGTLHAFSDLLDVSRGADDLPVVRIKVHSVDPRPALMVEVSTDGIALSEEAIATLFESAGCHAAGAEAALLLSAAAKIARAHGGRVDARRGADGGLVTLFVLPK